MCDPVTLTAVSIGMSVVTAGAKYMGEQQQAESQANYQQELGRARNEQMLDNANRANEEYLRTTMEYNRREREEGLKTADEKEKVSRVALEEREAAKLAAAEAGVAGLSVDALVSDYYRDEARSHDRLDQNKGIVVSEIESRKEAAQRTAEGRIGSIQPFVPSPITQPSFLGSALEVGIKGVATADKYLGLSHPGRKSRST